MSRVTDVREMNVEELMSAYDDLRDEAEYLPSDDPRAVEVELTWSLMHQVFDEGQVS